MSYSFCEQQYCLKSVSVKVSIFQDYKSASASGGTTQAKNETRRLTAEDDKRRKVSAEQRANLECKYGGQWDGMTSQQQIEFVRSVLPDLLFEHWQRNPQSPTAREDILQRLAMERSGTQ